MLSVLSVGSILALLSARSSLISLGHRAIRTVNVRKYSSCRSVGLLERIPELSDDRHYMRSTIIPVYHTLKINAASDVHKMIMQMVGMHTSSDHSKYASHFSG